jgi:glucose/arabinose dehydrogenase
MKPPIQLFALALFCAAPLRAAELPYRSEVAFPHLKFENPLFLLSAPDAVDKKNRLCVVEQDGFVRCFDNDPAATESRLILDISKKVRRVHNEEGLLGLAFHPGSGGRGTAYVFYSASDPLRSVVAELDCDLDPLAIDAASEKIVLEFEKPYGNHNGGMLAFGPDGHLYISVGDGGSAGDPKGNGQSLRTLLGKILRIDVMNADKGVSGRLYSVPADNPFLRNPGARPEIYAYGLRNVWRFSFDTQTGALWAGDVGQDKWEEIDIIHKGGNYGWNLREGAHTFKGVDPGARLIDPVVEHGRQEAQSITGGYVYRGKKFPELDGAYIYGDFMSGNIWALWVDGRGIRKHKKIARGELISSFGQDAAGEIYFTSFDGKIYTLAKP